MKNKLLAVVLLALGAIAPAHADPSECSGSVMWSRVVYNTDNPRDPDRVNLGTLKLMYSAQSMASDGRGIWCSQFVFSERWRGTTREGAMTTHGCTTAKLDSKGNCPNGHMTTGSGSTWRSKWQFGPARLDEKAACGWVGLSIGDPIRGIDVTSGWRCR